MLRQIAAYASLPFSLCNNAAMEFPPHPTRAGGLDLPSGLKSYFLAFLKAT